MIVIQYLQIIETIISVQMSNITSHSFISTSSGALNKILYDMKF